MNAKGAGRPAPSLPTRLRFGTQSVSVCLRGKSNARSILAYIAADTRKYRQRCVGLPRGGGSVESANAVAGREKPVGGHRARYAFGLRRKNFRQRRRREMNGAWEMNEAWTTAHGETFEEARQIASEHFSAYFAGREWEFRSSRAEALTTWGGRVLGWQVTFEAQTK